MSNAHEKKQPKGNLWLERVQCGEYKRIGLFGGSFDPIHCAHIACAQCASQALDLDLLVFIPSYINPFKQGNNAGYASPEQRLEMCEIATRSLCGMEDACTYVVWDREIEQALEAEESVSYTVDTVQEFLKNTHDTCETFYIVGTDSAKGLPQWHDTLLLSKLIHFCIVKRPGISWDDSDEEALRMKGFVFTVIEGPTRNVFSSDVRLDIEGSSVEHDIPSEIVAYIREHKLYGVGDNECIPRFNEKQGNNE